jgi:hypothetical protein
MLTEPSQRHGFIKARQHGPRNTPAAHPVARPWLQSDGPKEKEHICL